MRVWVDGQVVDMNAPTLRALDHGVTVGDGAFETCKIVDGKAFALTRHFRRLGRTLDGLGLPQVDEAHVREGIEAVLSGDPIPFGRVRITVTGGLGPLSSDRTDSPATVIVAATPSRPHKPSAAVITVPWVRNERGATAGLKTTSYAENVIAISRAISQGAEEALMANTRDELCEGTASNVFVVTDGVLRTPPLESGCLAGITRELAIEWGRAAGLEVVEETLPFSVLETADEVIISNSSRDVQGVHVVDGRQLAAPGPITQKLVDVWRQAERDLGMDP
ncbi:class IV aminotransferase [Knoellia subterranea KCTC 19937]|uniref:Class IV aminotransferase n=1 Tax=Knoellia subterranea KCTC 19937 TaxID=1385521 RepID=A0A0A0JMF3_9MICO|nr:class IV aminotransferase [Knoellia subterranea KCTC 19937]